MSPWLKALIVVALVVPMTAYVAGSLVSSSAREPADRGPVIIRDAPSPAPATPGRTVDEEARVVTPTPTPVDDDDEDGTGGQVSGGSDDTDADHDAGDDDDKGDDDGSDDDGGDD